MPKFPGVVRHNNAVEAILNLNENQVIGLGVFSDEAHRNSLNANMRCEGFLSVLKNTDKIYIYTSSNISDTSWVNLDNWVVLGLKGDPGDPGDPGQPGQDGKSAYQVWLDNSNIGTEEDYLNDIKGAPGDPGPSGVDGLSAYELWLNQGNIGSLQDFLDSLIGPQGDQGLTGPAGATGATGDTGPVGPVGPEGPQGIQGLKGDTGATGPTGETGPAGPAGPAGPIGATGPAGTNGIDGKTVLSGTTNPTTSLGVIGDFYINTSTNLIFGPKTAGGWGSGVSLVGPQGATGATGDTGPQGPQGATGATGATGDTGATGPQGEAGPQGPAGATGATGANGVDGKTVLSGDLDPTSANGVAGDFYINTSTKFIFGPKVGSTWGTGVSLVGPTGPQGETGPQGLTGPKGDKGDTGDTGAVGATGATGADGKSVSSVSITEKVVTTTLSDSSFVTGPFSVSQDSISAPSGTAAGSGFYWDGTEFVETELINPDSEPILVSLPAGKNFGKYESGDTINIGNGQSVLDIIRDAVQDIQAPVVTIDSITPDTAFNTQSGTHTLNFTIDNPNDLINKTFDVTVSRKLDNGSFAVLQSIPNNSGDEVSFSVNYGWILPEYSSGTFTYRVTASVTDASSISSYEEVTKGNNDYVAPSLSSPNQNRVQNSSSSSETSTSREYGNVQSNISFTVNHASNFNIKLTKIELYRKINGGSESLMYTNELSTPSTSFSYPLTLDDTVPANSSSVQYVVKAYDQFNGANAAATLSFTTINFNMYAFKFGAHPDALPSNNSQATTIYTNLFGATSILRNPSTYSFGTGWDVLGNTSTNNGSYYTYIIYPLAESAVTGIFQLPGTDVTTDFESIQTLSITNQFNQVVPYRVYKSKFPGAFGVNVGIRVT